MPCGGSESGRGFVGILVPLALRIAQVHVCAGYTLNGRQARCSHVACNMPHSIPHRGRLAS
jgi:hypothetical protein